MLSAMGSSIWCFRNNFNIKLTFLIPCYANGHVHIIGKKYFPGKFTYVWNGWSLIWVNIFKNWPSKICGRQQRLPSTNVTWSSLEYLDPYISKSFHFINSEWSNTVFPKYLLEDPMKRYYDNAKEILPATKLDSDLSTVPEEEEEEGEADNAAAKLQGKGKIIVCICGNIFIKILSCFCHILST